MPISKRQRTFDNLSTAIAVGRRCAKSHDVIVTQTTPTTFRVYLDRETYSVTGDVKWTNLWDLNAATAA